jgi:PncC family amidohydrolase|tara:strand:+ start:771 stop:1244 length:474 start_codon:yes stop_codon:yes gene_type:complete
MKSVAKKVVKRLLKKKLKISIAESCTGGLLSSCITSIAGSSKVFNVGLVTYSNQSKINILKISKRLIKKYGAVSEEICVAMAKNVRKIGASKISFSITGIAGPNGGTKKKPVGLVYIGLMNENKISIKKYLFKNNGRSYIQRNTVRKSLKFILTSIK